MADQKAAQDLNKDYLAIVSGDQCLLFKGKPVCAENGAPPDPSDGFTLEKVDLAQTYYTSNGTKITFENGDIKFNGEKLPQYCLSMRQRG
eukprot:SAG11_NODE_6495_length_1302_cov_1.963425_4_plen_90_part_00